jgi:hypothetical protein
MKIKVSKATPLQIDWMVAQCIGGLSKAYLDGGTFKELHDCGRYNYSTDWAQGGPLIEREGIAINGVEDDAWKATLPSGSCIGPTMLIAAMRCYVASKLGDEVEVPDELV